MYILKVAFVVACVLNVVWVLHIDNSPDEKKKSRNFVRVITLALLLAAAGTVEMFLEK